MGYDGREMGLQLRSLVSAGTLQLSLVPVPIDAPADDEVVIRIEAAPINPSDLGLLLGPADPEQATSTGTGKDAVVTAPLSEGAMRAVAARVDQSLPVGNEGAGIVVAAGASDAAQALVGRTVAILGGATYAEYKTVKLRDCLPLPEATRAAEGASCFVNPLTALGMVETMRMEGHSALVHTAAASNLGQMLNRVCVADGVGLVNIVRSPEQAAILKKDGAVHVCDSSAPDFRSELENALVATGATLAFDAIGGGKLAGQILAAMEVAINRSASDYSRYGSATHKQVYLYGMLDTGPTILNRSFGMAWGVGGWLLTPFLQKLGREGGQRLRGRVAAEIKTTFASHYSREISLAEALDLDVIRAYARRATGEKFLINPAKGR